jgi:hypothetical protein
VPEVPSLGGTVTMSTSLAAGGTWKPLEEPQTNVGAFFGVSNAPGVYLKKMTDAIQQSVAKSGGAAARVEAVLADTASCLSGAGFGFHTSTGRKGGFAVPVHCGRKNMDRNLPVSLGNFRDKKSPIDSTFTVAQLKLTGGEGTVQLGSSAMSSASDGNSLNVVTLGADFPREKPLAGTLLFRNVLVHAAALDGATVAKGLATTDVAPDLLNHPSLLSRYDGRTCDGGVRLLDAGPLANHLLLPTVPGGCAISVAAADVAPCSVGGKVAECAAAVDAACTKGSSTAPDVGACPKTNVEKVKEVLAASPAAASAVADAGAAPATTAAPLQLLDAPPEVEEADLAEDALEEAEKLPSFIPWTRRSSKLYRLAISVLISSILCLIYEIGLFFSRRYLGCPAGEQEEEEEDMDEIVITSKGKKMTRREAKERSARKAAKREAKRRAADAATHDLEVLEGGLAGARRRRAD